MARIKGKETSVVVGTQTRVFGASSEMQGKTGRSNVESGRGQEGEAEGGGGRYDEG